MLARRQPDMLNASQLGAVLRRWLSGKTRRMNCAFGGLLLAGIALSADGQSVLTYHNNNARTGANTNETRLTLANVNTNSFGLLMRYPADGYVYTQPLYVPQVDIPGKGKHDVVFVASENDSVYAFDANGQDAQGGLLWRAALGEGIDVVTHHEFGGRYHDNVLQDMLPRVGITGTPVIDAAAGTLYVVAPTREVTATATNYYHHLHALDIATGAERPGSPVLVEASFPGTGVGGVAGVIHFDARTQNQRCALTLAGGTVYVAYSSYADTDPYHGWIIGYDAATLRPLRNYIFNTTPNATIKAFGSHAGEGALWMAGSGLCVDAQTNLFYEVANGSFDADSGGGDYGDSFVKMSTVGGLAVADYFTPFDQAAMQANDQDLGSGGCVLLPEEVGSTFHPHLLVGGGKAGKIYLVDCDHLGFYHAGDDHQIVESFPADAGSFFSTPAYFNHTLYYQGIGGVMKAFGIGNGYINSNALSASLTSFRGYGTTPSISANGTNDAIVWAIQSDAATRGGPAVLHAYNATNLALELYDSRQLPQRDDPGNAVKMTVPTVADGHVFVGVQNGLAIFGLGTFLPVPAITPAGGSFSSPTTVTLSDDAPGVTIYYTVDGTAPTASSPACTGPLTITNSCNLHAIAIKHGAVDSGIAAVAFTNTADIGHGSGLTGEYWPAPWRPAAAATVIRTDPTVDFAWKNERPADGVGPGHFSARWTGSVQAKYSEAYTFMLVAGGGVRLRLNGLPLVDHLTTLAGLTTNTATLTLQAQQLYNIQIDYLSNGGAEAKLSWRSPSTPPEIIPRAQLYPNRNPPPTVTLVRPAENAVFSGIASVTVGAEVGAPHNAIGRVDFYANGLCLGTLTNSAYAPVYALTATGLTAGLYSLTAVASDGSGLTATSAPVRFSVTTGNGKPYGLTRHAVTPAFLGLPPVYATALPPLLSDTGVFADTARRVPADTMIPYQPNVPLWADGAVSSDYLAVPHKGGPITPDEQMRLHSTNSWKFPNGTVFVKNLDLTVDERNPAAPRRRVETQILVCDASGGAYGVSYKWRSDQRDAGLIAASTTEDILITNSDGVRTQTWYYASPADCLTCHTPVAGYVLGVNTRQLNGNFKYPETGVTDNQIRSLNRLGLFSPALNEARIADYARLSPITDGAASLEARARSYLDANCSECHCPGGVANFDARFDTPLDRQHLTNFVAGISLGYANAEIIAPGEPGRSVLFARMNTNNPAIRMPPLSRNRVDSEAVRVVSGWIKSFPVQTQVR